MKEKTKENHTSTDVASVNKVRARQFYRQAAMSDKYATGDNGKRKTHGNQRESRTKEAKSFNLLQLNISGLRNKKTELAKVLADREIHIACLQETQHRGVDLNITGYTEYPCKCNGCQGIVTYIRNDVQGDTINLHACHPTDVQKTTVWHCGRKYTIYNIYSPPSTTCNLSFLQEYQFEKTVCAGDFNGHSPSWGYKDYNDTGREIEELCDTTNLTVLQDSNSPPTLLHRAHKTLSRPDLTICSSDLEILEIQVIDDMGSDHRPISIQFGAPPAMSFPKKTRWNFKKADWAAYKKTSEDLFSNLQQSNDIDQLNNNFTQTILEAATQHIPRGCRKKYKPFWNEDIQTAITEREKARQELEKSPSPTNKTQYNRACAKVKLTVKKSKKDKWSQTCENLDLRHNGRQAWSLVNNLSGKRRTQNPKPIYLSSSTIEEDQKKAEHFNRYFASVNRASRLTEDDKVRLKNLKEREKAPTANLALFEEKYTMRELRHALKKLRPRKSPGPDKIHNEMLRKLGPKGRETLLHLINSSWEKGQVPKAWKIAQIIPILKSGKPPGEPKSYRPISLTSCIGKLAERMVNNRLYWYLESTNTLNTNQAGFRKGSCTEDQLFRLTQNIQDGFQSKKHTVAVFVDLQQAYDKVWRKGLLMKMQKLGIHGKLYNWIKFFLNDRNIETKINNASSSREVLEEGLPQGSCLSCTLFLVYINDVADVIKAGKTIYADDLALWQTQERIAVASGKLNDDLSRLNNYCREWKLKINCSKTVYTIFTKSHKVAKDNLKLKIGDETIVKEQHPTYLGVQLDQQLSLNTHVDNLKTKARKRLQLLKKLAGSSWGSDRQTLRSLYLGYVRSALEYSNSLLAMCSKTTREKIDKVQNNALQLINGSMRSTPIAACEILANVEPLDLRREKAAIELYERSLRMSPNHPNHILVNQWKPKSRLKQKSILHFVTEVKDKHHLPQTRKETPRVNSKIHPSTTLKEPQIELELKDKSTKATESFELMMSAHQTISSYPDDWIHIYTDGSAFKGTTKAGYGILIEYPGGSSSEFGEACGERCTNYEAEKTAIETALYHLKTVFDTHPTKATSVVIFTDALSVLQALKNSSTEAEDLTYILLDSHHIMSSHGVNLIMQWIPGHTNTPGNDRADTLAKKGSKQEQPTTPAPLQTVKQVLKANTKEDWMNRWAMAKTGRIVFKHMPTPKAKDNIDHISRKEQSSISRLRTQHIPLNQHLNRIQPQLPPMCPLCNYPSETVEHHLLHCPCLEDLRTSLLPPRPSIENTLYGTVQQLRNTCTFHFMALDRRTKAQMSLDR